MKERKLKDDYRLESYIDHRGREKRRAVYQGAWYRMDEKSAAANRRQNLTGVLLGVFFTVFYLIYMKLSTPSAWCMYVLPIAAAALIPLLYWGIGLYAMLRAPQVMTRVQRETGVGRVMRSSMGCMILVFMAVVGDVIFMIRSSAFAAELPGFALLLCAAMIALYAFRQTKVRYDAMKETAAPKEETK